MLLREGKSEQTFKRYLDGIKKFTEYMQAKSPDDALAAFILEDHTVKLDAFVDYLIGQKKSAINLKAQFFGIKKWLIANRINSIDWEFISRPKATSNIRDRIPTTDELGLILDNKVTLRDKAFFLVDASGGFRIGTLLSLKVKDYQPVEELGMITVNGGDGRKLAQGKTYFSFLTPEARRILEDYLKTRENLGPEDPLFAKESKGNGQQFTYSSNVSRQWTILVKRAKLLERIPGHRSYTLHGHSLRKFFQTHAKLSGCRADFVDFWMGHHPTGANEYLNDSYFRPDLKEHLNEYRKAVDSLTIFDKNAKETSELKKQFEEVLKNKNAEVEALKTRLQEMEQNALTPEEIKIARVILGAAKEGKLVYKE